MQTIAANDRVSQAAGESVVESRASAGVREREAVRADADGVMEV